MHQRQRLQGMHDGTGRRDRLCLHSTARAAPDDACAAVKQEAGARPRDRDRPACRTICREGVMMTIHRKPVAFGDMRNWMKALKSAGELREIDAEVDWNVELGTITRMAQGPGTGPAL